MTIKAALKKYSAVEIELLLGHVLKQSKEFLYLHPNKILTKNQQFQLGKLVRQRKSGFPIAYLLGYKDFFGLKFAVNKAVLIPRPESEWLVERAIKLASNKPIKILDLGTGSGCLAISIKTHSPKVKMTAVDVSNKALGVAKKNAQAHQVNIKFKNQNLLSGDKAKYDLIIANLPYVPKANYQQLKPSLIFEPISALVDPKGDFSLYQQLLSQFARNLTKNGRILFEIDPSMKPKLQNWIKKNMPCAKITFTQDIHKLVRFAELSLPEHGHNVVVGHQT